MRDQSMSIQALQREIRVFISSTFRDMKAERDELVKRTFPQLRKLCEERQVTWGEVDLRWGVTDEQTAEGKVLPICLEEIKQCRPYFIGLLGERYGWLPDKIPQELIEQEPWLKEHLGKSVTELEILHGVLKNPEMAEHAFFYFRDPAYVDSLPPEQRKDFTTEDSEGAVKLRKLKDRILKSGFPVRENYSNPRAQGELILKDLTNVIDKLFPEGSQPDPLDREAADHETFARSRARVYIGRQEYFNRLDTHAGGDGQPLAVLGESGSGKSALLANWALQYREKHKEELLITHFIGGTPYSTDWAGMLRRIMGEFKRRFDFKEEIPDKPDELRMKFANWLHMTAAKGRVVIILDALNQLEDRDGAPDLVWLPPVIPANVRLIVSTLPGRPLNDLKKRGWQTLNIEPLQLEERRLFIEKYLAQYTKALSPHRVERIVSHKQAANPLFLRALLEELRQFGEHEKLDKRIDYYLKAQNPYELYTKILIRWEEDYEGDTDLVGESMSLLWAARRGLSETELLYLLGKDGKPLPHAEWSPLFLAARDSLVSRSGLLNFFHDYLRDAVRDTYIPGQKEQQDVHLRLAGYFENQTLNPRKIDELPWQLREAKSWQRLYELMANLAFFQVVWDNDQYDVKSYWAHIEHNSPLHILDAYRPVIQSPEIHRGFVWDIATLLSDTGHPMEAFALRGYLVKYYKETDDINNLQASLGNQALILKDWGRLDEAMKLLEEQERICRELGNKDGLSASLGNQALILQDWGRLDEAMKLHKEEERICRELGDKDGLSRSLGNQALILYAWGRLDEAMKLHKEKERICRELGNKDGLQGTLGNQALILKDWGRLDEAMKLHKEEERICRELRNINGLAISLTNQAGLLSQMGKHGEALPLVEEAYRIATENGLTALAQQIKPILEQMRR